MASQRPAPDTDAGVHELGKRSYHIAPVAPLDLDGSRTVAVGTAIWFVMFLGLLPFFAVLRREGDLWVLWTCLAGCGLGLVGWDVCRRRSRQRVLTTRWDAERERAEADPAGNPYDHLPSADPAPPHPGGGKRARR